MLNKFNHLWVFAKHINMETTNNLAERDLRKLVIWRKKSYGTRSDRGKKFVETITTISQTLRKQEKNVLQFIQQAIHNYYTKENLIFINAKAGF